MFEKQIEKAKTELLKFGNILLKLFAVLLIIFVLGWLFSDSDIDVSIQEEYIGEYYGYWGVLSLDGTQDLSLEIIDSHNCYIQESVSSPKHKATLTVNKSKNRIRLSNGMILTPEGSEFSISDNSNSLVYGRLEKIDD